MQKNTDLGKSLLGGFNKEKVLNVIEELQEKILVLKKENEALKIENYDFCDKNKKLEILVEDKSLEIKKLKNQIKEAIFIFETACLDEHNE